MKAIFILIFIVVVGCNTKKSNNTHANKLTQVHSLKDNLIGKWGGLGEDSPVWKIELDSIYYYQEKKKYPYQILGRDLIIERAQSKGVLSNISVIKDTMIFSDEQGLIVRGFRFK
ncbi:MAG: hypothetical protein ABI691_00965 [Ginsengibacter sp.]